MGGCQNKDFNKKRLIAVYEKYNPKKLTMVDPMIRKYKGKEIEACLKLEAKYGENPTRVWLTAFYQKYNPTHLKDVDHVMNIYKGKEEVMFLKLTTKYKDPPLVEVDSDDDL